ncbi:MAG: RNA-directed DNA polymerase [Bacteroidetes bacterium]|nr:RNA-directed DNA polymerase [Bacteroidota bacterium]
MKNLPDISIALKNVRENFNSYFNWNSLPQNKSEKYKLHEINALILLSIKIPTHLCLALSNSISGIEVLINNPVYTELKVKKKSGEFRQIYAPNYELKRVQKRLNYFLQGYYLCIKPNEVNGFVINPFPFDAKCNIAENAKYHVNKKHVLNIDIKNFFPSISAYRVKKIFTSELFNFNEQVATALTLLCTYKGVLPIGAPTSPVISNFICFQLDRDLKNFCNEKNISYSRYADDLTFSSNEKITDEIISEITLLINKYGFELNKNKFRLRLSNRKQVVTGLVVNEKVNIDRKLLKKIRAMLHDMSRNGIEVAAKRHFKSENPPIKTNSLTNKNTAIFESEQSDNEINIAFACRFKKIVIGYINFVGQIRGTDDRLYNSFKAAYKNSW